MIVLGIDPGPIESAYVFWDGKSILGRGKIAAARIMDPDQFLVPEIVAIEMISSYGMSVGQETFETCRFEGKYEMYFEQLGRTVQRVKRRDVKLHLCETSTAKDKDVIAALTDRIGPKGVKKEPGPTFGVAGDVWQALAVAVYAWDMEMRKLAVSR